MKFAYFYCVLNYCILTCFFLIKAELWIEEKLKKLEVEGQMGEVTNLEDKIKKLQKHQAFQAEITANQDRITAVKDKGKMPCRGRMFV